MSKLWIIYGVIMLLVWGFDFKYDADMWTWLWFSSGLIYIIVGLVKGNKE